MDFDFKEFRTENFENFSFENLIGYYNYLRLIPVQYLVENSHEFKNCIHEILARRIDILSLQSKMPSSRTQDESEKATNLFLNEFFALTNSTIVEEALSKKSVPVVRSLPKTTGERLLKQYTQNCSQMMRSFDKCLKALNKMSSATQTIVEKTEKSMKKLKNIQPSLFD